jgi:molybdopterin molybdotransferase
MAQLSNDCFANDSSLLRVDDARARILARIGTVAGIERVALATALGRILAEPVTAALSVPPAPNSAVDGYALRHADLAGAAETVLRIVGRAAAGHPFAGMVGAGEAVRIFTGALLPAGADTVMMQEDCIVDGSAVRFAPGIKHGANTRPVGEDFTAGAILLPAGRRLRPQDVGLLAAAGVIELAVRRPLRLAILSTGDEVRSPGSPLASGQIYDANRFMLLALAQHYGIVPSDLGILPDRRAAIETALDEAARDHDVVMSSGGVSTGDEDHVRAAVTARGSLHFWRLAIKPGRPVALGQINDTPFVGLPGNPVAAMVTFLELARPLLQRLAGAEIVEPPWMPVKTGFAYRKKVGRREYLRVRLVMRDDGTLIAEKFAREGAGIISSLTESDGLMRVDEETAQVEIGTPLPYRSYAEFLG